MYDYFIYTYLQLQLCQYGPDLNTGCIKHPHMNVILTGTKVGNIVTQKHDIQN